MARAGLTTEALVAAAATMADEIGYEQTTLAALARRFGVRLPSLYAHLRSAEHLRTLLGLHALALLAADVTDAIAGRAGRDALFALANAHRAFAAAHPGLFEATHVPLSAADAAASGGARISRMMRAALRDYALGEPNETHAVRLLGSVLLGFTTLEAAASFAHSSPAPDESWTATLEALDQMLRHWPTN